MHKKAYLKLITFSVGLMLLIFQTEMVDAETASAKIKTPWQLWAKPRICVVPEDRRLCKMETDLGWAGYEQADICLSSSEKETELECWVNALDGHLLQSIMTEKPITYWLNRAGEEEILIKTQIRIISIPKKQIRRRRRHIWSLL